MGNSHRSPATIARRTPSIMAPRVNRCDTNPDSPFRSYSTPK
jgi:hypothetical protein